jgi:salicylate hydroxylase
VEAFGVRSLAVEPRDALTGRRITRLNLSLVGGDWIFVRRSALQVILCEAALAAGVILRTSSPVVAVTKRGVRLESGVIATGDLVIGADGIHSVIRRHVVGEIAPFFSGQVAWRTMIKAYQEPVAQIWMAPGRHVVTYPISGSLINIVAVREENRWTEEGWSHQDDPAALRLAFPDAAPELAALLGRVEEVGRWGLFRHPVPKSWYKGKAVLLGDAAHPTLPFLAQGANLALEDAWVLARECSVGELDEGLHRYERLRRPRVMDAVSAADANARNYHLGGLQRWIAHQVLGAAGTLAPRVLLHRLDWLYGFDATAQP